MNRREFARKVLLGLGALAPTPIALVQARKKAQTNEAEIAEWFVEAVKLRSRIEYEDAVVNLPGVYKTVPWKQHPPSTIDSVTLTEVEMEALFDYRRMGPSETRLVKKMGLDKLWKRV